MRKYIPRIIYLDGKEIDMSKGPIEFSLGSISESEPGRGDILLPGSYSIEIIQNGVIIANSNIKLK
jgi:hypothetical protein